MTRRFLQLLMVLTMGASASALAQAGFNVTSTTVSMTEGGLEDMMLVETDNERFSLIVPHNYGSQSRADTRSISFTSGDGVSVITVQFTTNYAGGLPKQDKLRDQVAANHPGASLVASSASSTSVGPAQSFDLFRPAENGLMLRMREVYVAYPEGSLQFTFSCNSADFDKQRRGFGLLLNSFHLLAKDAK